jgi:mRNA-degrading endonuclease RelE of RelBE toxin-antitoxin system
MPSERPDTKGIDIDAPAGEEEEHRVDPEKIAVGQRSSSAAVVIRHQNDIDQDLPGQGDQDEPPVQGFSAQEKQDGKQKSREKVPGDPGEPAKEIIKNIVKDELEGLRSFRVSRFRIVYRISKKKEVEIISIGPRARIYEETFRVLQGKLQNR